MPQKSSEMAICRDCVRPRKEPFKLFTSRFVAQFWKFLQEEEQIPERIKPITFGSFDYAET